MCSKMKIYNSRNYSILLNTTQTIVDLQQSTTVEIILYYLTILGVKVIVKIYNSRNYSILLNSKFVYLHNFFGAKQLYFYYFI